MKKERYEEIELELIRFTTTDVILASDPDKLPEAPAAINLPSIF